MRLDFSRKTMDIGTFPFNLARTLSLMGTGGAELSECLLAADRIRENDQESWAREWASLAAKTAHRAEQAAQSGQAVTACQAYMRASNYYRSAMFSLPPTDARLREYLTLSRELFREAARLHSPAIEIVDIPYLDDGLPGYFMSGGRPGAPTLLVVNGGDSTNEEFVHWIGFAAAARGWNCLIFEGPGQWSAQQRHPEWPLRPDWEVPVKAAVDYLAGRDDVDADKIALIGYSLGAMLAARAAAFEPRIRACVCDGLITDVNEAWVAVMPAIVRNAPTGLFDWLFSAFEKMSPQLAGFANHYRWIFGVSKPHEIFEAWKPYSVNGLAPKIECPLLLLYGEAEVAQSDAPVGLGVLRFVAELRVPVTVRTFGSEDGWAATHCQVGAISAMQAVVFDWLDRAVAGPSMLPRLDLGTTVEVMRAHWHNAELEEAVARLGAAGALGRG